MCILCASIPAAAAVGAKLNADQIRKSAGQQKSNETRRYPITKITGIVIGLLVTASAIYHTLRWGQG